MIESTDSDGLPPDALEVAKTVTFEYPPTVDVAVKELAPSASLPLVTT